MIRKAKIGDVKRIQELINSYAKQDRMLPRSLNELYENIRDFFVYEEGGEIRGTCALHVTWEDLAEIKSLTVEETYLRRGIGKRLLLSCIEEAKALDIKKIFALTYEPEFFKKFGFVEISKAKLPHKIWNECINCVRFPDCDERAVMLNLGKSDQ